MSIYVAKTKALLMHSRSAPLFSHMRKAGFLLKCAMEQVGLVKEIQFSITIYMYC